MNHQPPFKASEDFVYDKDGHKVCMCWGRQGNPKGGNQEAETIAKALNYYHRMQHMMDVRRAQLNRRGPDVYGNQFSYMIYLITKETFPNDH